MLVSSDQVPDCGAGAAEALDRVRGPVARSPMVPKRGSKSPNDGCVGDPSQPTLGTPKCQAIARPSERRQSNGAKSGRGGTGRGDPSRDLSSRGRKFHGRCEASASQEN